jgi:hypothetical protein
VKTKTPNGPDLFKTAKQDYLVKARIVARKLLERREYVTIDDVREACPLPSYLHRNLLGSVFQTDDFQFVGYARARRKTSNGREVKKWALKHPPLPEKWVSHAEREDTR